MSVGNLKDKIEGNEIDLSLCNLTEVPVTELADIPEATHLDLSCNFFTSLPDSFCLLTHLVKIDLSKNKLTALPEDFGQLVHLEHLDLMGNDLVTLPASFCQLDNLQWLDLKGNPLDPALRETAGDCLDGKQCRECAHKVLQYMRGMTPETEKDDENGKSRVWVPEWLPKLPSMIILGLVLAVGTLYYGGSSMKRRLCAGTMNPIFTHLRSITLRMAEFVSHVWHAISNAVL